MKKTKTRRREITVEMHSLTIIRTRQGKIKPVFCGVCLRNVAAFSLPEAALIFGIEEKILEKLVKANEIHQAVETDLCGDSLAAYFETNETKNKKGAIQ